MRNKAREIFEDKDAVFRTSFLFVILLWPSAGVLTWYYVTVHFNEVAPFAHYMQHVLYVVAVFLGSPPEEL